MDRIEAALLGAREVGFTVLSISLSLVAVFIPLLLHGRAWSGRLFREFAVTLSVADHDLAGRLADHHADDVRLAAAAARPCAAAGPLRRAGASAASPRCSAATSSSLDWALRQPLAACW